jgi:hypothetical protein
LCLAVLNQAALGNAPFVSSIANHCGACCGSSEPEYSLLGLTRKGSDG